MDGDRPMVDGRDLLESRIQELIRDAWTIGCIDGENDEWRSDYEKELFPKLHELLVSYYDRETSDVGAQDETSEAREVGDSVRSEPYLSGFDDPIRKITDEFAHEMGLRFAQEGKRVVMGNCDLTESPDGSIHASIYFYPQNYESGAIHAQGPFGFTRYGQWRYNPQGY